MLVMPLRSLGMWVGQAQRATASGERIFQVLDEPEDVADRPGAPELPPGDGAIRFEDVSFSYLPGRPVLEHLDLALDAGTTVALIGHTGSGKTTLASLVPRFYDVDSGRVLVDGVDVRDVTLAIAAAARSASITQDPFLFSTTVRENIAFGRPDLTDDEVERVARLAQAHEFVERLPQGYDDRDRRARHHALGRAAPADRDRPRARGRPAHPHPRRRDRLGRRDDRGPDPHRPARGDAAAGRR